MIRSHGIRGSFFFIFFLLSWTLDFCQKLRPSTQNQIPTHPTQLPYQKF
nr:MAG TPA: hypothetical protein [Caudoviricetes sp.]